MCAVLVSEENEDPIIIEGSKSGVSMLRSTKISWTSEGACISSACGLDRVWVPC